MKAFVTLIRNQVAVSTTESGAIKNVAEMIMSEASNLILTARQDGESRVSLSARVVYVEVNQ
jgi:hypothetical protein